LIRSADFQRRIHLQIIHVLMRRRAAEVDHDHRFEAAARFRLRLGFEKLRQRQPAHGETANAHEITTRDAIAKSAVSFSREGEHVGKLRQGEAKAFSEQ
ncbi:MAG: hypothetical protein ACK56I_35230, partial [bacterium]